MIGKKNIVGINRKWEREWKSEWVDEKAQVNDCASSWPFSVQIDELGKSHDGNEKQGEGQIAILTSDQGNA